MTEHPSSFPPPDPSQLPPDEVRARGSVRAQSAVVRSLADAMEQVGLPSDAVDALRSQLAEEVTRLRSRIAEADALERAREDG